MRWRVVMEVARADAVRVYEIGGGAPVDEYSPGTVGLTLAEGKLVLAGLQHHLVQAQTEDHCCRRRRCQRCGVPRPIKDKRSRRLLSLFGAVNVSAPRFAPCRCAVTRRQTLSPVSEIMPDRCTPEYERVVAKMGASLPYRRARTLLSEFLPLDDIPSVETARRQDEPISTAVTESTVQWLLHRRMNAQQHMRWAPRGAHLMLKVRTATANGTLERGHVVAERCARRPFRRAA